MRVLITGISGFVGSHLAELLAKRGDTVLGLGFGPAPPATAQRLAGEWRVDVCDLSVVEPAMREAAPEAIVHLAAQSSAGQSFQNPVETYRVNALGTLSLLESVRRAAAGARVLVVGTGEVYGPQPPGSRAGEGTAFRPVSPYAFSKTAAEAAAEHYSGLGLDIVRARPFGHLGFGQTDRFLIPALARQIARAEAGHAEPVVRAGNLDATRDLTDVRDVVEAYRALLKQGISGAVYNVCRGEGVALDAVARSLLGRSRIPLRLESDPARMRPADIPYLVGDPRAIEAQTGWRAAIPLEVTLDEVMEEWRASVRAHAS